MISRRSFLASTSALPVVFAASGASKIPIGLELYSVRNELKDDLMGTVRAVAKQGYQCVEFFSPYTQWTADYAKEVRKLLDDVGVRCYSTHNGPGSFSGDGMSHAIELNHTLGAEYIVMASAGRIEGLDGWKKVAETLNQADQTMKSSGLHPGYHNHQLEFTPIDGKLPMEVLAANTTKDIMLQLDVGTCVQMKQDPVAWIDKNPGRIRSLHLKDWSPENGYKVLFGEGVVPWAKVIDAAVKTGGARYFLIEQEGSRLPAMETSARCLENYRKLQA
ncbi:MAG: sugar phosphate isomerase/epimerase [Acidobacteriaceae bacterium]|nr:sugar phosphate isomerase/epimerase [Acidobacteriaceae bacterium]